MPVTFHRLAAEEFVTVRRWYARRSPATEARFVAAVELAVQSIEANPAAGTSYRGPYRWVRVRRFPYLIYYEAPDPTMVLVYAVAHARRRPGYWRRRVNRP
jgi:plasmid stabilization system protein ParE